MKRAKQCTDTVKIPLPGERRYTRRANVWPVVFLVAVSGALSLEVILFAWEFLT